MKKKAVTTAGDPVRSSDPSFILAYLEETLENETARIRSERERQEKELADRLKRDLYSFRKEEKEKAEKILTAEKERLSRTFELEGRRIISRLLEELFEEIILQAAEEAGKDETTFQRIITAVRDAAADGKEVVVAVAPGDEALKNAVEALDIKGVAVVEDSAIHRGGAIVSSGGDSVLNLTIERLLFRKKESLRLEMMKLLREEGMMTKLEEIYGSW